MWSDLTCPFSYISKRLFDEALEQFPHREHVHITYRSYILYKQPSRVKPVQVIDQLLVDWNGTNRADKLNNLHAYAEMFNMSDPFTTRQQIDTLDAHRLVKYASTQNKGKQLLHLIEDAHFIHHEPIADHGYLQSLGEEVGLSIGDIQEVLASCMFKSHVRADMRQASEIGIEHIPFLVFNETCGVPTIHKPEGYAHILHAIWEEQQKLKQKKDSCTTTYCTGDSCEDAIDSYR